jgi:hypothetical protein
MDRVDARYRVFKEKLKRLGYIKDEAKKINKVMTEKRADFGMMSDAGNKKIARAVAKAKTEEELRSMLDKISKMAGGKYAEASEEDVVNSAVAALSSTARGMQLRPDANDTKKDTEVRTDDMEKLKIKHQDASKVYTVLMSLKTPVRSKYLGLLQKDIKSFKKTFDAILKVANR